MRKGTQGTRGITATVALLAAAALLIAIATATWVHRGPMNHGWDWPWHDWWHSRLEHSGPNQYRPTMTQTQMLGWAEGQTFIDTTGRCST